METESLNSVLIEQTAQISSITGVSITNLELYFNFINKPAVLNGIIQVTEQLQKISDKLSAIILLEQPEEFMSGNDFACCLDTARSIIARKEIIESHYPQSNIHRLKETRPFRNLYAKAPVYTLLGVSSLQPKKTERHLLLEAHIVIAAAILRHRKQHDNYRKREYQDALIRSCRLGRKILLSPKDDTHDDIPDILPVVAGEYMERLKRTGSLLDIVNRLFDYAFTKKRAKSYSKTGQPRGFRTIKHSVNDGIDPELIGRVDTVRMIQPVSRATNKLECDEPTGGFDLLLADSADKRVPMEGKTSDQHKKDKQQYLASIAMHNQRLNGRWEMLTAFEVSCFISAVCELATENGDYDKQRWQINNQELAAVAITVFLRSLPLTELKKLYLCDARNPEIAPPGYQFYGSKTGYWIVLPPLLPLDMKLGADFFLSATKRNEFFYVTSGTGLEKIIDRYVEIRPEHYGATLFSEQEDKYDRPLSEFLSRINKQYDIRLTIKRIEIYLHNTLARQKNGDLTTAMLLTGRKDFLGISPLHYSAFPVYKLQELYRNCCTDIIKIIRQETTTKITAFFEEREEPIDAEVPLRMAGTAYRPTASAVGKMVAGLQERMNGFQKMPRNIDKLVRLHNNIMRYTAILFAFSTGFRAVNSPLLPPSQIDFKTGFAAISDKDGLDFYNARIVWLPPVCVQQYTAYLNHLDQLMPKLEYLDLDLFNSVQHILEYPLPSDKFPLFFFMTPNAKRKVITPTDIWKEIRKKLKYEMPENASRHYIRSYLLEVGCPPEYIAAFMGHWERGEEPWGTYSALSPQSYAATLSKFLVRLLSRDGWKPMAGIQEYW